MRLQTDDTAEVFTLALFIIAIFSGNFGLAMGAILGWLMVGYWSEKGQR